MITELKRQGEGRAVWVVGDRYTIKTAGAETGGAFAMMEALVPPGSGPPPHIHTREDEAFYLLEGELEFHCDGRTFRAGPGSSVTLAKGSLHRFVNTGTIAARMLIVVVPAGLDDFFLEVGRDATDPNATPAPTPDDIARLLAVAPRYGLHIHATGPR